MNTAKVPVSAFNGPYWFDKLPHRLREALEAFNIVDSEDFTPVKKLAEEASLDAWAIDMTSVVLDDETWRAPGTVHVTLRYDVDTAEAFEFSDSYPMSVEFTVEEQQVKIQRVEIDTRSFFL